MEWSERFATGHTQIDTQHKLIFQLAGDFRSALDEGRGKAVYGSLLDSLDLYVRMHFSVEEGCMHRAHCPVAKENKEAHLGFMSWLKTFREDFTEHGYHESQARRLVNTIDNWLVSHICRIDVKLRESAPLSA